MQCTALMAPPKESAITTAEVQGGGVVGISNMLHHVIHLQHGLCIKTSDSIDFLDINTRMFIAILLWNNHHGNGQLSEGLITPRSTIFLDFSWRSCCSLESCSQFSSMNRTYQRHFSRWSHTLLSLFKEVDIVVPSPPSPCQLVNSFLLLVGNKFRTFWQLSAPWPNFCHTITFSPAVLSQGCFWPLHRTSPGSHIFGPSSRNPEAPHRQFMMDLEQRNPSWCLGNLPVGKPDEYQPLVSVMADITDKLTQHLFQGLFEFLKHTIAPGNLPKTLLIPGYFSSFLIQTRSKFMILVNDISLCF